MSTGGVDPSGLSRSLEEAMRLLSQATGGGSAASPPPSPEALFGRGTGADGLVEAEVSAFGRLESLAIDPRLLRSGAAELAESIVAAVRAAQDDERARRAETLGAAVPDTAALTQQLERVSDDAFRGFNRMISDLDALTRRMDRG